MSVLTDLRNRGVRDTFFLVCDGLKGLPEVVANVWPATTVQTCIIHLIRNTFRLTSRRYWDELKRDIKPIYTAVNEVAARSAFEAMTAKWGQRYPAVVRLWDNAWNEFIPFLDYDIEIRRALSTTNAIESLNARYRRAVKARGHFPSEQAAMKCLYLVTRSLDPTGHGRARWAMRWLSRPEARCRHCCRSVSSGRSPNPACVSPRTGLSTVGSVRHGSFAGRGWGSSGRGSGNG
jgi:transposase-like protein